jgi:hypothetical protein
MDEFIVNSDSGSDFGSAPAKKVGYTGVFDGWTGSEVATSQQTAPKATKAAPRPKAPAKAPSAKAAAKKAAPATILTQRDSNADAEMGEDDDMVPDLPPPAPHAGSTKQKTASETYQKVSLGSSVS